jgi:uncharacterized protein DUF3592
MRFVAIAIGLGFTYVGLMALRSYLPSRGDRGGWPQVQGRIVGVYEPPDPDLHVIHRPRVAFRTLDGRDVDAWSRNTTYNLSRRIGGPIGVRYDPANPEDFSVDAGPDAMKPIGWVGLPIALLFLGIGLGLLVANLR